MNKIKIKKNYENNKNNKNLIIFKNMYVCVYVYIYIYSTK